MRPLHVGVILTAVLINTRSVSCLQSSLPTYAPRYLHPALLHHPSAQAPRHSRVLGKPVGRQLLPQTQSGVLHGGVGAPESLRLSESQKEAKRNDRKLFNKSSKKTLVTGNDIKDSLYAYEILQNGTNDSVNPTSNNPAAQYKALKNSSKTHDFEEIGISAQEYYLQELEKEPLSDSLKPSKDIFLDRSDLRSWKYKLLKKVGDDLSLEADLKGFMQALSNAKGVSGAAGHQAALLPLPAPSTNSISVDLPLYGDLKSKMSVHSSKEVSSAEVRDLALKRWLKSSSAAFSSNEAERKKIEELSYKILSLTSPEEESKDEANDSEIYKAVFTSVAAYQIRKLQRKLRNGRVKRDEEMVCYKDLGCFRDDGAFDYLDLLPSPPEEINTKFLLFTRKNPEAAQVFDPSNSTSIHRSHYDPGSLTKVIIHGFGSSCHRVWVREMRVALLTMVDVNLICVDWENGARVPNYMRAASNTRLVGRQVGRMVEALVKATNTSLDKFHLIGFSLGAHVSGHAGKKLKLKRISGLDPAGPLFENFPPSVRLDASDAEFVDVIHTNADSLIWGGLGAYQAMGHVDFYPNGGRMQKGCTNLFVGGVSDILWPTEGDGRSLCNHRRGYKYFVESIAPVCKFPSFVCTDYDAFLQGDCFPCEGCGNMGYYSDKAEGRGQLYLVTRDSEPFCANQYKVSLKHSGGPPLLSAVSTYGRVDVTFIGADGINETIPLTRMPDEELKAGSTTVRILVPHPAITGITSVQLLYTAYDGWLSSGSKRWAIDKVSIMDSFGTLHSFCKLGVTLETGVPLVLPLQPAECTPRFTPWRPPLNERPEESTGDLSSTLRPNGTSGVTVIEHDVRVPDVNSSVNKTPETNIGVIEKPTKTPPSSPVAHDLHSGEASSSFSGTSSLGHPQSSVIISFPGSSRLPPSEVKSPSSSSASSSFSISLPSAPSQPSGVSGTAYKFVPPRVAQDAAHTNLHWSYNYDDFFDVNHQVMRLNGSASHPNYVPTLVVTSQPISDYVGSSSSEKAIHVGNNETRQNVSNLRDGPAPNLYPASMTEGMEESDYSLNISNADFATTTPTEELLPGVILRPKNFSSSQSRVVIKVNETPAKLWGLTGFQTVPERDNITNSSNGTSTYVASANSKPDKSFSIDAKNESSSSEMKKIAGAHTKTPSIEPDGSIVVFSDFQDERSDLPNLETRLEYYDFDYAYQNQDTKRQSSLLLGKHDDNRRPDGSPLTPYVSNPYGFEDANNPGLETLGTISYNSLVDGEVPMNERARALFSNSNKENNQALTPPNEATKDPIRKATDPVPLTQHDSAQYPPVSLSIGISSPDARVPNFNTYRSEQQYNIKFQRQPNERNESPILSANLRPPAAPTLPQMIQDRQRAEEKLLIEGHLDFATTSAPSYLRQLSAFIPQLFSNPLSSQPEEEPEHTPSRHLPQPEKQSNRTLLSSPSEIIDGPQVRVKGVKLVSGDSDVMITETTSSSVTSTERSFPYSWSYFFGRRSSEETDEVAENEEAPIGAATGNTDGPGHGDVFDYPPKRTHSSRDEGEHGTRSHGEWSSSYVTHELLHHTPAVQQKHVSQPHHFSHSVKTNDALAHVSRYGTTSPPGNVEGFGVSSPHGGKPLNHRRNEPSIGRRRPRHQHRFHLRGGKSGPGPLRHPPKAIKLPKNLPPNYPFYQLNPLTALPTHLVAPPPLNVMSEPRRASKGQRTFRDKNSAREVAESLDFVSETTSAHSNKTEEPHSIVANSTASLASGNLSVHSLPETPSENIDEHQEASTRTETIIELVKNVTHNSTERRMERKLNIDKNHNIRLPSLSHAVEDGVIEQASSDKLHDASQPLLGLVSYNYNQQNGESTFVSNDNYQRQSLSSPHLPDDADEVEPFLERDSLRYAMSHVPSSQASPDNTLSKHEYHLNSPQWTNYDELTGILSNGGKLVVENIELASSPNHAVSPNYNTMSENEKDSRKENSPLSVIQPPKNVPGDSILADASSASDEFSFADSSYASLLPSPALPDPLSSNINPEVMDEHDRFLSEQYIPAPSLTYKSFLSSPSEMSSAEYRERFASAGSPSDSAASLRDQQSVEGLTAHQSQERSSDSSYNLENSDFRDETSFGGRSLSVEYDLEDVLRKMSHSPGSFKPSFYPQNAAMRNQSSVHENAGSSSFIASDGEVYASHPPVSPSNQYRGLRALSDAFNAPRVAGHEMNSNFGPRIPKMDDPSLRPVYDSVFPSPIYNRPHSGPPPTHRHPSFRWNREVGVRVRGRGGISVPIGPIPIGPIPIVGPIGA